MVVFRIDVAVMEASKAAANRDRGQHVGQRSDKVDKRKIRTDELPTSPPPNQDCLHENTECM